VGYFCTAHRQTASSSNSWNSANDDQDDVSDVDLSALPWTQRLRRRAHMFAIECVEYVGVYTMIHWVYFVFLSLMSSWIYFLISPANLGYTDSLFTSVSALTCTGLITYDTSAVGFAAQFFIFLCILLGSSVLNSSFPLLLRIYRFQRVLWTADPKSDTRWVVVQRNAVVVILLTVCTYYFVIQLIAAVFLVIYTRADSEVLDIYDQQAVQYVWGSVFYAVSAFNNAGFAVFASNLIPFASEWLVLTVVAILILLGNTCFPIVLRAWFLLLRVATRGRNETINLIHRKPRAYYTHLFSVSQTFKLIAFIVISLVFQFVITTALDFDAPGELDGLSAFYKIWNVMFQSISTRNAGFNSVSIALSSDAVIWIYIVLMFVGVFPVAASVRSTRRRTHVSGKQALMALVLRDMVICASMVLLILIVQHTEMRNDAAFTLLGVLFEVSSAFGNVGLSLGYANDPTSLSGRFNTLGKLLIIATMLIGKHRALAPSGDIALAGAHETLAANKHYQERDPTKADSQSDTYDEDNITVNV
jgi:Trk-type K+ transport system membrane component